MLVIELLRHHTDKETIYNNDTWVLFWQIVIIYVFLQSL